MVRKRGSKDITGKDTILHVSMKKSQPQMRLPINLNNIIQDIQSRYNINTKRLSQKMFDEIFIEAKKILLN